MFRFFKRDIVVYTFTLVFIDFILEQNHGITNLNLVYGFHVFPLDIYIYIYDDAEKITSEPYSSNMLDTRPT